MTDLRNHAQSVLIAGFMTVASLIWAGQSHAAETGDREGVEALLDTYVTVRKAADVDGIANLFHDNATIWAQNVPPINGRPAIHAFMTKVLTVKPSEVTVDVDTIAIDGNLAFVSALTTMTVPSSDDPDDRTLRYRALIVLEKRDGHWRVLQDIDQPIGGDAHYE